MAAYWPDELMVKIRWTASTEVLGVHNTVAYYGVCDDMLHARIRCDGTPLQVQALQAQARGLILTLMLIKHVMIGEETRRRIIARKKVGG